MKVVRIIARLNVGGPARHVVWLEEGLRRDGVESVLVTGVVPEGEDDMTYFARARGVEPVVIPEMSREVSPKDAVTAWKLYRLLRRERPGVVHTHTAKAGTVGRAAGFLYRWLTPGTLIGRPRAVRFVHTYHGHIFHSYYGRLKTRVFLTVEKLLARLATDRIVVISRQQYREIHEEFGVGRAGQFRVVPLGLDLAQFDAWAERREAARSLYGAGDTDVLVGIVGRLTEIKNHEMFLEAAAIYLREHAAARPARRVRFLVIGDGHLRVPLEARARDLGLGPDDVTFTGTLDDPENFYPALDVVALTSLNEGTPLTLVEAMANARAVIATSVGGVVDLLGETEAQLKRHESEWRLCERGVLVERGDARAFAHGLDYLVEHQGVRAELGERGRKFVAREYSLGRLLADVSRLYSELGGGGGSEAFAADRGAAGARSARRRA
ncbi:MAG TPA: glycosyltransferase [Pyrinomonadaceae bacterium]|nr:glycosyltransferase [Pyrinomonadaceae bacterium]